MLYWPWGMWDLSSLTRDQSCSFCIGRWSRNHWTTREVPKQNFRESFSRLHLGNTRPWDLKLLHLWKISVPHFPQGKREAFIVTRDCWFQFSSVTQSCPALCDPVDCSMPIFPVHHQLPEITQTHVHRVGGHSTISSHPTISSSVILFFCVQSSPASGSFPMSQFFASGGQSIGVSASASVLPMNIQDWFPLGLTGWISLLSKGLSRFLSNITVQNHNFFGAHLIYSPTLSSIYDYWKNHGFD